MTSAQENRGFTCLLEERCLIKLSGDEAAAFLQDIVTHDVLKIMPDQLVYSCLLTPQGRFLHDFFIFRDETGFFLECETLRRDDLLRRLKIFRLRAKVVIEDCAGLFDVYAANQKPEGETAFHDPRLKALGYRVYLSKDKKLKDTTPSGIYRDLRISLGIPEGTQDIKPETDMLADVNIDCLNAVSWDKGCYVGQEVTARMNYRGLAKKRMVIVSGHSLAAGDIISHNGGAVGDIRSVNTLKTQGLAILKLTALQDSVGAVTVPSGVISFLNFPEWLTL